ncbi:hypothetical protein PsorP6_009268 [Peronosclerospora sorghi]|uniref:Uncharacterized protein n=1 Tax=Peronosclerospora sorghi TaxID=230839 RepID=A0ACC0VZ06_9STRA|nr:hypothetical protein PsorP6_009268 [Peronosclerospora sorghi]
MRVCSDREEIEVKTEWELEYNNQAPVRSVGGDTSSDETRAEGTVDECSLVWRCGVSQLLRHLRHKACIHFATENVNAVAGVIVAAMLDHSAPWEREKDEATTVHDPDYFRQFLKVWFQKHLVSKVDTTMNPIVLVNKLPVTLTYRVRLAFSSAHGSGTSDSTSEPETIAVGANTSIWWTDIGDRPLFQLVVEGCTLPSKWLELAPRGTARGALLSVQLSRVDDRRQFRLLLRIVGDTDHTATPVYVEFLADIWVINRSGLDLVYGTAAESEAYIPPPAACTNVGNAQISAYSSENSGKIPVKRIG